MPLSRGVRYDLPTRNARTRRVFFFGETGRQRLFAGRDISTRLLVYQVEELAGSFGIGCLQYLVFFEG